MDDIRNKVIDIIANCAGVLPDEFVDNAVLMEDLGLDDMAMDELAIALEDEFKIDIPDDVVKNMMIEVKDVIDYVERSVE